AVQGKKIELQMALDEEMVAMRQFNNFREVSNSLVREKVVDLDGDAGEGIQIDSIVLPDFSEQDLREDIKVIQHQRDAINAAANIGTEKVRPSLDLFGQFALNGKDDESTDALSGSMKSDHPTMVFGVKFSMPLDPHVVGEIRSGYALDRQTADINYEKKLFDLRQEYTDLRQKFFEAKKRVALAFMLQTAQRKKLEHERTQLQKGRTTTFQVLTFEQEGAAARLSYIKSKAEVLKIVAQLRSFSRLI
ncbi:MAG: TolC family protein, partial [Oligoflexia bacterium]|nr:TolC family protein [Oligoflexia bacterium]